jgi:hypothetical protein
MPKKTDAAIRFWARVNKNGPVPDIDPALGPCWLWEGALFKLGYGQFWFNRRNRTAHTVAWELANGAPASRLVLHKCNVKHCVRPTHLYDGTHRDNSLDCLAAGNHPGTNNRGTGNGMSKLSERDVVDIFHRLGSGEKQTAIAAYYHVDPSHISHLKAGRGWGHIRKAG